MKGKDLFKVGVVVIVGGALLGLICAALSGAFTAGVAITAAIIAAAAMLFGWVLGSVHGEDVAERRACARAIEWIRGLERPMGGMLITRENCAWNKALDAAIKVIRAGFRGRA